MNNPFMQILPLRFGPCDSEPPRLSKPAATELGAEDGCKCAVRARRRVSSTMLTLFLLPVLYSWFVGQRSTAE
jgi:hypothetical protein